MKILFVHLLNNYTGSPRVLSNFLMEYVKSHNETHLLTSKAQGCLSDLQNVHYHFNGYKWISNKLILAILLLISQIYQFLFVLFGKKYDCVYINTILPFGAAFACKIRGFKTVYHIHEFYPNPSLMQKVCVYFSKHCASKVIFVSDYLRNCYKNVFSCECKVIHNSVSVDFHTKAGFIVNKNNTECFENYLTQKFSNKQIVLPCALKKYKGVFLFIELAKLLPNFNFLLVTSNSKSETKDFFVNSILPKNFQIENEVKDMAKIFSSASLVMNLSVPHGADRFIETFSMILIESFEFATPCIAPCYGGPLEIIQHEQNGFLLEIENLIEVKEKIEYLFSDFNHYKDFCNCAYSRSKDFLPDEFIKKIKNYLEQNK